MQYRPAELDDARLRRLKSLETELGKTVVAVESQCEPATMTTDQLDKLKKAEQELGVVLVAYEQ